MMIKNINTLRKRSIDYQNRGINNQKNRFRCRNYLRRICFCIIALAFPFILKEGFNTDFIIFLSTFLSIFIGFFGVSVVFAFDNYSRQIQDKNTEPKAEVKKIQVYNFTKEISNTIGFSIVLSILVLILLMLNLLFDGYLGVDISISGLTLSEIKQFFSTITIAQVLAYLLRFVVIRSLLTIIYNMLHLIVNMILLMNKHMN